MTFSDTLHYISFGNPVSKAIIGGTTTLLKSGSNSGSMKSTAGAVSSKAVNAMVPPLWKLAGGNYNFIRLAGLSGASAVILGAIGSHKIPLTPDKNEERRIFETANRFHFFHSLALLGMPLVKYPFLTGTLMLTGTVVFSGILYYRAFTGDRRFARYAPMGGTCLIFAWLSLLL